MHRFLHGTLDRMLLDPGMAMCLALRCSRRLRAWRAWRCGALGECASLLRRLRWLGTAERRMLRNCDEMLALLRRGGPQPDTDLRPLRSAVQPPLSVQMALHSCQPLHPSGYGRRSEALVDALRRSGVAVTPSIRLGYPCDIGMPEHVARVRLQADRIGYRALRGAGLDRRSEGDYLRDYASALHMACIETGARVIHAASNYLNGIAAADAGAAIGLPVVYEVRGLWHVTRAAREAGYAASEHYAYCDLQEIHACMDADRVVVLSEAVADYLVARGVPRARITLLPNAADGIKAPCIDPAAIRARFGLPAHGRLFGYIGALVDYEGLSLLVEMLDTARLQDWILVFAGHGSDEANLRRVSRARGVADRVRFLGYLQEPDVASLYALLDACAVPRLDIPLTRLVPSQKPYESLAYGCPVVVSAAAAAAIEPMLRHEVIVVEGRDAGAWGEAMLRATAAPRPNARVPTWDDRAATLVSLYQGL